MKRTNPDKVIYMAVMTICTVLLGPFNSMADIDTAVLQSKAAAIRENSKKIADKEAQLDSLKAHSAAADIWNFIGRRNQELAVQKRSRLMHEISAMRAESAALKSEIVAARPQIIAMALQNPKDSSLEELVGYADRAAVELVLDYVYLDEAAIKAASKQFLERRHSVQSEKIMALEALLDSLKAEVRAYKDAGNTARIAGLESYIYTLGERLIAAKKSQELIGNTIKNVK
ncbi:MAG: hypothetical protein LLG37_03695 [Spirochaetia bacterium]|nr:hypothetical protein [Spirochaetia bacterium]